MRKEVKTIFVVQLGCLLGTMIASMIITITYLVIVLLLKMIY